MQTTDNLLVIGCHAAEWPDEGASLERTYYCTYYSVTKTKAQFQYAGQQKETLDALYTKGLHDAYM